MIGAIHNKAADWYAPIVIIIGLFSILFLHLVPAYLAGLIIFFLIRKIMLLMPRQLSPNAVYWLSFLFLMTIIISIITITLVWGVNHIQSAMAKQALGNTVALGWERFLNSLPTSISQYLPTAFSDLMDQFTGLIGAHWGAVGEVSRTVFHGIILSIVGLVVGALIAFDIPRPTQGFFKLLACEVERAGRAFWEVLSAQFIISLINTGLTTVYLFFILPAFSIKLPYPVILLMVTFVAGLMPVLGNLISNTVILLVSFTVSAYVALASLVYLVLIHKLEYFLNAHIIGARVQAKPWELLISFFVFDAAFGLPGLMVSPFFYGYYKLLMKEREIL